MLTTPLAVWSSQAPVDVPDRDKCDWQGTHCDKAIAVYYGYLRDVLNHVPLEEIVAQYFSSDIRDQVEELDWERELDQNFDVSFALRFPGHMDGWQLRTITCSDKGALISASGISGEIVNEVKIDIRNLGSPEGFRIVAITN